MEILPQFGLLQVEYFRSYTILFYVVLTVFVLLLQKSKYSLDLHELKYSAEAKGSNTSSLSCFGHT